MPAYFAVGFQYKRHRLRPDYLRAVYSAMLQGKFTYGGVLAWGCQGNLELEDVIRWNQERFNRDFQLGYREDVSNDYRQLLLRHGQYRECRVIIHNEARLIYVIVPEDDVFDFASPFPAELFAADPTGLAGYIREDQVEPLKQLAIKVWQCGLAVSVQTYGELGSATDYESLKAGKPPSMLPFAIVWDGWIGTEQLTQQGIRVSRVGKTGILLQRQHGQDLPEIRNWKWNNSK